MFGYVGRGGINGFELIIDKPEAEVNNCSGGPSDPVRGPTVGGVARTMAAIGFCKQLVIFFIYIIEWM